MCGRFTNTYEQLPLFFTKFGKPEELTPRFNIAPTQDVAAVANMPENERKIALFHWGLIPSWSKDTKFSSKMINARSETLSEKPSFRNAFKRQRCLILADGYYEWVAVRGLEKKQPVYIRLKSQKPFAFAGLWEVWHTKDIDEPIKSCTIITCSPTPFLEKIHHRMPVILPSEDYEQWLDPNEQPTASLQQLLKPYENEEMEAYAVSHLVNSPRNDTVECIAPI